MRKKNKSEEPRYRKPSEEEIEARMDKFLANFIANMISIRKQLDMDIAQAAYLISKGSKELGEYAAGKHCIGGKNQARIIAVYSIIMEENGIVLTGPAADFFYAYTQDTEKEVEE